MMLRVGDPVHGLICGVNELRLEANNHFAPPFIAPMSQLRPFAVSRYF
jgi:hypothetical protein